MEAMASHESGPLHAMTLGIPSYMFMEGADSVDCLDHKSKCRKKHAYYYNDAINF